MVRKILTKIDKELKERKTIKDELYDAMRKATRLSKRAIFSIHKEKLKEAKKLLVEAGELFETLNEIPTKHKRFA